LFWIPKGLAMLWEDLLRGGITVDTPEGAPRLRSVVQLDGDTTTLASATYLDGLAADTGALRALMVEHQARVAARLKIYASLQTAGPWLHYGAWTASVFGLVIDAPHLRDTHVLEDAVFAMVPLAIRYLLPRVLPGLLKLALGRRTAVFADTRQEVATLRARRVNAAGHTAASY
jgi:hypothetical protein